MRRVALCFLLAACSGGGGPQTPEQACASQANDDPVVKQMVMKGAGTDQYFWDHADELRLARRDATLRCLRSRGLAPKGGVERQRAQ